MENGKIKAVNSGTTVEQDAPKAFTFTFAPSLGYMFNDNMGVGLDLMFGMGKVTAKTYNDPNPVITTTTKTTTIGFAPYFRYVFAEVDNFKFYADARIEYLMSTPKIEGEQSGTTVTVDGPKTTNFGVGIVPGMQYNLTDNISMNCALNILELGFASEKTVTKDVDGQGTELTEKTNEFGFGVNYATPITIGFFYTF